MLRRVWLRIAVVMATIAFVLATPSVGLAARGEGSGTYQAASGSNLREAGKAGLIQVARVVRPKRGGGSVSVDALLAATSAGAEPADAEPADVEPADTEPADAEPADTELTEEGEPAADVDLTAGSPSIDYSAVETTQYSNAGIHLLAPAGWEVDPGSFGSLFNFTVPNTEFAGFVQSFGNDELPGVLAVVLFRSQPEMLVTAIESEATLLGVDTFMTDQKLPVTKISLSLEFDGAPGEGAIYLVSPGTDAIIMFGFAEPGIWQEVEPGVDLMAESIFFDPELITLTTAENGAMPYSDAFGVLSLVVPEDWQVAETDDVDFPLVVVDPDLNIAGILGMGPGTPEDEGFDLDALLSGEGDELDAEVAAAAAEAIRSAMDIGPEEFMVDEALTRLFPAEDSAVLRLGGTGSFDEDLEMPVVVYLKLDAESISALVLFGTVEEILDQEPEILELLGTVEAQ